jgi:rubredoxin
MATWVLTCPICDLRLAQFAVEDTLVSFFFPKKPDFPEGGKKFECPNCGYKSTYERTDLTYI